MTDVQVETAPWSRRRWLLTIAFVLLAQAALIFLLEKSSSATPRKTVAVPLIHLREHLSLEPLAVSDPTLFVLPHQRGFSGEAWLNHAPTNNYQPADWTEPATNWPLATASLGANFEEFINANTAPQFETIATFEPARRAPGFFPSPALPLPSSLRIEGALAQRRLLTMPELRAWESTELVSNSMVQVLVDAPGRVISAVRLSPAGGLKQPEADARALELARAAQFAPATNEALTVGTLLFEWQTLPVPATNAPVATP